MDNREKLEEAAKEFANTEQNLFPPEYIYALMADFHLAQQRDDERLLEFIDSLYSFGLDFGHGKWQDGEFTIFDDDGEGLYSGKTPLEAINKFLDSQAGQRDPYISPVITSIPVTVTATVRGNIEPLPVDAVEGNRL